MKAAERSLFFTKILLALVFLSVLALAGDSQLAPSNCVNPAANAPFVEGEINRLLQEMDTQLFDQPVYMSTGRSSPVKGTEAPKSGKTLANTLSQVPDIYRIGPSQGTPVVRPKGYAFQAIGADEEINAAGFGSAGMNTPVKFTIESKPKGSAAVANYYKKRVKETLETAAIKDHNGNLVPVDKLMSRSTMKSVKGGAQTEYGYLVHPPVPKADELNRLYPNVPKDMRKTAYIDEYGKFVKPRKAVSFDGEADMIDSAKYIRSDILRLQFLAKLADRATYEGRKFIEVMTYELGNEGMVAQMAKGNLVQKPVSDGFTLYDVRNIVKGVKMNRLPKSYLERMNFKSIEEAEGILDATAAFYEDAHDPMQQFVEKNDLFGYSAEGLAPDQKTRIKLPVPNDCRHGGNAFWDPVTRKVKIYE